MLAGTALLGNAQNFDIKLGLWEATVNSEMAGMPAIDTSNMTPDQKARIEAMMKGRGGAQATTTRQCMTKEKLDKQLFEARDSQDASCKRTVVSRTSSLVEMKLVCTGDRKMTGDIRFEAVSRENVKGNVQMVTGDPAHPMNMKVNMNLKWLSDSCGDVK
jgi:hypothetical protein